jgi:hypothetical protein
MLKYILGGVKYELLIRLQINSVETIFRNVWNIACVIMRLE